jgi:hypothetical protein
MADVLEDAAKRLRAFGAANVEQVDSQPPTRFKQNASNNMAWQRALR